MQNTRQDAQGSVPGASKIALHAAVAAFCVSERTPNNTGEAPRGAINPVPRRGSRENTMSCQPSTSSSMSSSMLRSPIALASLHAIASHVTVSAGHETAAAAPTTPCSPQMREGWGPHGAQRDDVRPPVKRRIGLFLKPYHAGAAFHLLSR